MAVFLALAGAPAAHAVQSPQPGVLDPRIRTVFYNPEQVVSLHGYLGYQTMIEFGVGERIENVSIGDALGWQVTPNKRANLLFLKPVEPDATTNMTVVTDRRRYAFELRAARGSRRTAAQMAYVVRFLYPPEPLPPPAPVARPPAPPKRLNTAYSYTGSRASLPAEVFDDGRFTYFRWPERTATPALFMVAADGSESLLNFGVREGFVIVEQVAPRFALHDGKDVTTVINDGWREPVPGPLAPRPHDSKTAKDAARSGAGR